MRAFHVRVNGDRLFRITPLEAFGEGNEWHVPVDCRDARTGYESQSIVEAGTIMAGRDALLADSQTRDAITSAYYHATSYEAGTYPSGGAGLPDDFTTEIIQG